MEGMNQNVLRGFEIQLAGSYPHGPLFCNTWRCSGLFSLFIDMFQLSKKHLRYSKYKPTNIDWIGDIPEGWGVRKMSHTLESCYAPIKT